MIGYYVHHHGAGHLNRARAVAAALGERVVGLSSLRRPEGWAGDWLWLDRDDTGRDPLDQTAGGHLHWAPVGDTGLARRMSALSRWIERHRPSLLVSDVSVEIALLARLHGVPVVSVVLPGDRGDSPHRTGFAVSTGLVAAWPREAGQLVTGLAAADRRRLHHVGAVSRLPVGAPRRPADRDRSVLVLGGRGGGHASASQVTAAARSAPGWRWRTLGGDAAWVDDPGPLLERADVVVCQAGEGSLADAAAARRPAVVVPVERPFGEQVATGRALASGPWPCRVVPSFPESGWPELLEEVAGLDADAWGPWCDGHAGERLAEYLLSVAAPSRRRAG